jgi:hypothetical protein
MRVSALLLGVLPTAGSVYLAHIAVASAGFERRAGLVRDDRDRLARSQLWYGGMLDPVIIEARRATPPAVASRRPVVVRGQAQTPGDMQCTGATHPKYSPTSFDEVRTPIGVVM